MTCKKDVADKLRQANADLLRRYGIDMNKYEEIWKYQLRLGCFQRSFILCEASFGNLRGKAKLYADRYKRSALKAVAHIENEYNLEAIWDIGPLGGQYKLMGWIHKFGTQIRN